jgi:hypothetical protein
MTVAAAKRRDRAELLLALPPKLSLKACDLLLQTLDGVEGPLEFGHPAAVKRRLLALWAGRTAFGVACSQG